MFDATERRSYERELLAAKRRAEESEVHASLLSRTLQQTLIPPEIPHIPGLDVAAVYRPAGDGEEIGGDFYDVFQIGVDDWMVAIGDVQGKGANAAVVTALARVSRSVPRRSSMSSRPTCSTSSTTCCSDTRPIDCAPPSSSGADAGTRAGH